MRALGLDPALGGGNAIVCAEYGEHLTILDCKTDYGLSRTEEQLEIVTRFVKAYRPSLVIVEFNSQQKGLGNDDRFKALAGLYGFRIQPHYTGVNKRYDPVFSVASMDQDFAKGLIRIPYGDDYTRTRVEPLLGQLRSWRPDVQTKRLTQDLVMALWFVWRHWAGIRKAQDVTPVAARRPSWLHSDTPIRRAS